MSKLTDDQIGFLRLLASFPGPAPRASLPLADRKQDRVRQSLRRLGLAEFVGGWHGKHRLPMGWQITPAGRAAIAGDHDGR